MVRIVITQTLGSALASSHSTTKGGLALKWDAKKSPFMTFLFLPECQCDIRGIARIDEASGSRGCDEETGQCSCKRNVIGKDCNQCAEQHYGLSEDDAQGCQVSTKRQNVYRKSKRAFLKRASHLSKCPKRDRASSG